MKNKSLLVGFIGDSPIVRVLDYLLTERDLDFSITDIAKNSEIGRATLYRIWDDLIKNEIIVPTRIIGRAKLYKLNKSNIKVKKLIELDDILIMGELKRHSEKQKVKLIT